MQFPVSTIRTRLLNCTKFGRVTGRNRKGKRKLHVRGRFASYHKRQIQLTGLTTHKSEKCDSIDAIL